jgi:hypothetical protein
MSIKPLPFVGTDLWRARQILQSWTSLRRLTSDETDIVVRMIAQGLAEGRKRGFELAVAEGLPASQDYVDELPDAAGAQS